METSALQVTKMTCFLESYGCYGSPWSHKRLSYLYLVNIAGYPIKIPASTVTWLLPSHGKQTACSHMNNCTYPVALGCVYSFYGPCDMLWSLDGQFSVTRGLRAPEPRGDFDLFITRSMPVKPPEVLGGAGGGRPMVEHYVNLAVM